MRILRAADVPGNRIGGMSRFMQFVGDELVNDGHEIDYLFHEDIGLGWADYRVRRFLVPLQIVQIVRTRARRGRRYDVVEIHEPSAAAYCAARRLDGSLPPAVVMSHGVESRCRKVMLDYSTRKGERISLKQRYAYQVTTLWQSDFALRHADQVALSTTEDRDYLASALGISPQRVTIVNGGISRAFLDCPTGPSPGMGVIFLASWVVRKGTLDLIPAITRLIQERPGTPITIAGCGMAAERVLADFPTDCRPRIRVIPHFQGESALLEEYRRHAIYLAPSVFEGQLLTMLEAAAAGLAVIATNTCGMKDFVDDGINGLLFSVGNPNGLFESIVKLIDQPDLCGRLGVSAQSCARRYTWEGASNQFLEAIQRAIVNGSTHQPRSRAEDPILEYRIHENNT